MTVNRITSQYLHSNIGTIFVPNQILCNDRIILNNIMKYDMRWFSYESNYFAIEKLLNKTLKIHMFSQKPMQ